MRDYDLKELNESSVEKDITSIDLLRDFVKEKLGGDIKKLRSYNLKTLSEDRKYGDNYFERSPIVKAIMSLAFGDVWSGLSFDTITKNRFECDCINKYQNLFGINMCDQYFKGMQKFNPTNAQQQRALKVAHMSYSIGNLWVLPSSPSIASRILDNSYRYYMDKFLLSIFNVLTEKKRCDKTLQSIIAKHKLIDAYRGEDGFEKFVKDMMLEDFLDYYGKPTEIFPFVWSAMKDLDKNTYFDAVDQYCTFCEKFIPKRAEKIIGKLSKALTNTQVIQHATKPVAVTKRLKVDVHEQQQESNVLNRYSLEYQFITMAVDFAKQDIEKYLPVLADKEYYMTLARKMELRIEGFSWNELSISIDDLGLGVIIIFFTFPKPKSEPEALYGAIVVNRFVEDTLSYYTFEKCSHPGRWALGRNTTERHELMGLFDVEPTKSNFINLIISNRNKVLKIDVKALLNLPENFQVIKNMPEDPVNCVNYGMTTPICNAFIQAFPISIRKAMEFDDTTPIINGIHHTLSDSQALIEVKNGKTNGGRQYVYSIIKNKMEPSGIGYFMLLHVAYERMAISINGHFIETGTTGIRDTTIFEMAIRKGLVSTTSQDNWWFDPYDKDFKHPFLMNLSEKEEFDKMFPEHPLSQCRKFVKYITERL